MHIPENYLSPQTCGVMAAAMVPVWGVCIRKVKTELPKEKIALMGVGAAFSFISMMFNIPIPGGTTGHAVGGTLIAALLGPYAACLSVSVALLLQALIFGDGGVLAFGANCFNMAFVLPFVGYAVYSLLRKWIRRGSGDLIGAGVGAYLGINAAALCAAIEFGIQPMLFRDAAGNALYCPYGLNLSVPAMMIGHLTVFGLAEVVFTVAVLAFVKKTSPDMITGAVSRGSEVFGSGHHGEWNGWYGSSQCCRQESRRFIWQKVRKGSELPAGGFDSGDTAWASGGGNRLGRVGCRRDCSNRCGIHA